MDGMSSTPAPRVAGRARRVRTGFQVLLATVLALGAALLAVDVADWRYWRVDLSASGQNTLDEAILEVIDKLPEPVSVDVFFEPLLSPYDVVSRQAQARVLEVLRVAELSRRSQFQLEVHDPRDFERARERQKELGVEGQNRVVVSCGTRRAELELFGELVAIDWGNPSKEAVGYLSQQGIPNVVNPRTWREDRYVPAEIREFRVEEVLTQALLKVSSGASPRVVFLRGHGEPPLDGETENDLGRLRATLTGDGFEIVEWDPLEQAEVPEGCDVLALIGPRQPYGERTREAVQSWVEGGGRALIAPDLAELERGDEGGAVALLRDFGIAARPGIVCQPVAGMGGQKIDGTPYCALLVIEESGLQPSHPLTEPLRRRGRRLQFRLSPAFDSAGMQTETGIVLPLVTTGRDCWRDLPTPEGQYDFHYDPTAGEARDRFSLVSVKDLRATRDEATGAVRQGRVLGIASALFLANRDFATNRDFVLGAFNWLANREYRVNVSPLDESRSYLDFQRGSARPVLSTTLWLGLPGLSLAIGLLVFLRRRN
jgi:hypothetical protein